MAETIKGHLRSAATILEVNATAVHFARAYTILSKSRRRDEKTLAIQIKNLAAYRRLCISKGWG